MLSMINSIENEILELKERIDKISREFEDGRGMLKKFTGEAFITFQTQNVARQVIKYWEMSAWKRINETLNKQSKYKYKDCLLRVVRASEPSDVLWENAGVTLTQRAYRQLIAAFLSLLLLFVGAILVFVIQYEIRKQKREQQLQQNKLMVMVLSAIGSCLIISLNYVLNIACQKLAKFEKYSTQTDYLINYSKNLMMAQFLNTAGVTLIISIISDNFFGVDPEFNFARKYAANMKTLLSAALYAPLVPSILIIVTISHFAQHWIDKYIMFRKSSRGASLGSEFALEYIEILEYPLIIFSMANLLFQYFMVKKYTTHSFDDIYSIIGALVGIIHAALPMGELNSEIFPLKEIEIDDTTYDEVKVSFLENYDRSNPATSSIALEDFSNMRQSLRGVPFPSNFTWGASTSAYQIEGAWNVSGKGLSWTDWWNNYYLDLPLNETGNNADEFFYRFSQDVALMKKVGLKNFRMSISWTRVLPNGTVNNVNQAGVDFYNQVFNMLTEAGISPWVTLLHGDFPQDLSFPNSTGSWLNPNIPQLFTEYAEFCFQNFGDRVKNWITINEPILGTWLSYGCGCSPPLRCSPSYNSQCAVVGGGGNSSTEPYIAGKNLILSHSTTVQAYRQKYKATQGGQVGWNLAATWYLPWNESDPMDLKAVDIQLQFTFGWFAHAIVYGDYPQIMYDLITGGRLLNFTQEESSLIKGAYDFFGMDHYTSAFVHYTGIVGNDLNSDSRTVVNSTSVNGSTLGIQAQSSWLYKYPKGMRDMLNWVKNEYENPPIVILENGWDTLNESYVPVAQALVDYQRINVINDYIDEMVKAITIDDVNVIGYFVWAWMDNFEWGSYIYFRAEN